MSNRSSHGLLAPGCYILEDLTQGYLAAAIQKDLLVLREPNSEYFNKPAEISNMTTLMTPD